MSRSATSSYKRCGMVIEQATIIALASILLTSFSPTINSAVTAKSQRKMLKLKHEMENSQRAISEYLKYTSIQVDTPTGTFMEQYDKAYGEVFLYAPQEAWEDIRLLNNMIHNRKASEMMTPLFDKIVTSLASNNSGKLHGDK